MREVKFRAWNKLRKQFMDIEYIYIDTSGKAITAVDNNDNHYTVDKEVELMQYTGLKDKNGVEIYEGDIIRKVPEEWPSKSDDDPRTLKEYLHDMSRVSYVEYRGDRFCLVIHEYADRITGGQHGSIEVIGNIYENPELLK